MGQRRQSIAVLSGFGKKYFRALENNQPWLFLRLCKTTGNVVYFIF
jgi:hypothetical protein